MKFKKQRDEDERLERAAKIQAHLKKTQPDAAEPQVEPKADPKTEPKATPPSPGTAQTHIYPPLQPWEKIGAFGRREQFRPMTRAEHEAVQEAAFLKKQFNADQVHREKIRKAEAEAEVEQKANKKRAEHEARTGMRPYDPGRYCSVEEARRRGYLDSGTGSSSGSDDRAEWSSPGNPQGIMGGGRSR